MVIGSISGMAKKSMGAEWAFVAVAVMAIGNAGGRILAGTLSDKIGRRWTLCLVLGIQAVLMFAAIPVTASKDMAGVIIVVLAALIGAAMAWWQRRPCAAAALRGVRSTCIP
jgi:predicted MFS family arabinose efflux permease